MSPKYGCGWELFCDVANNIIFYFFETRGREGGGSVGVKEVRAKTPECHVRNYVTFSLKQSKVSFFCDVSSLFASRLYSVKTLLLLSMPARMLSVHCVHSLIRFEFRFLKNKSEFVLHAAAWRKETERGLVTLREHL